MKISDLLKNQKYRRIAIILGITMLLAWGYVVFTKKDPLQNPGAYNAVGSRLEERAKDSQTVDSPLKEKESRERMQEKAKTAEMRGGTSVELRQTMEKPVVNARLPKTEQVGDRKTFTRLPVTIRQPAPPKQEAPRQKDAGLEQRVESILGSASNLAWGSPGAVEMGGYSTYMAKKEAEAQRLQELEKDKEGVAKEEKKEVLPSINIPAGEILYAVLNTSCDSDQGSTPVMATIVSGKWKGAKCMGSFNRMDERLVVQFNKVIFRGQTFGFSGYAIDPKTSLPGVRSGVDTHFLERWGGLVAASFLQGIGNVFANQGVTTEIRNGDSTTTYRPRLNPEERAWAALGVVGEKAGQQFEKHFDRPPTVTLKAGTEIGILVL